MKESNSYYGVLLLLSIFGLALNSHPRSINQTEGFSQLTYSYSSDGRNYELGVMDILGNEEAALFQFEDAPRNLIWSDDGQNIAYNLTNSLGIILRRESNAWASINLPVIKSTSQPVFLRNKDQLIYWERTADLGSAFILFDINSQSVSRLFIDPGYLHESIEISHNNDLIATNGGIECTAVYAANINAGHLFSISTCGSTAFHSDCPGDYVTGWIPNQNKLVIKSTLRSNGDQFFVIDVDSLESIQITNIPENYRVGNGDLSPDGMNLIFSACIDNSCSIYLSQTDGSFDQNLSISTHLDSRINSLRWSPDGSFFSYILESPEPTYSICIFDIQNEYLNCLDKGSTIITELAWRPYYVLLDRYYIDTLLVEKERYIDCDVSKPVRPFR